MEVHKTDRDSAVVQNTDKACGPVRKADKEEAVALASMLFDAALTGSSIQTGEVAYLFGVSESLIWKMRSVNETQCPSFAQLLLLPPAFHIALIQELDKHYGLGRAMLARVQQAVGTLSLLVR